MAPKTKYINREISWLSFNNRVLQEVCDEKTPLIERIRFLAIFSSNLDEFFRVRVAALTRLSQIKGGDKLYHGEKPGKILKEIYTQVKEQQIRIESIYNNLLVPKLAEEKIFIVNDKNISKEQGKRVQTYFKEKLLQDLSPIMLDNLTNIQVKDSAIYFIIELINSENKERQHALLEIPGNHSRFFILPQIGNNKYIILLDDIIRYCMSSLFGIFDYNKYKAYTIKVTRDAELDIDTDLSISLMESISKSLKQRKKGSPVRFTYDTDIPNKLLEYTFKKLKIKTPNIIPGGRYHNFKDFFNFPAIGDAHLVYPSTPPLYRKDVDLDKSLLNVIRQRNILISVPYQSFDYPIYFLREAAINPEVTSIKITLYRLSDRSRIISALANAARNGKKVIAMLELKARFDEANNIYWTRELEEAGVQVMHTPHALKVHSKICLVTKKKGDKEERFAMLGTGNYNEKTAKIYGDYHYFTYNKLITTDLYQLFINLENNYLSSSYHTLIISPLILRKKINSLINKEIKNAKKGIESYIILKMNSLTDEDIIDKLYEAGKAGVKIKLIVRGICRLIPNKKELSENIEVISIVDKYLEHARVFIFSNEGKEIILLSSADMMTRNLDYRIEVTFPVLDTESRQIIRDMINIQLKDNIKARILDYELSNKFKEKTEDNEPDVRSQEETYKYFMSEE